MTNENIGDNKRMILKKAPTEVPGSAGFPGFLLPPVNARQAPPELKSGHAALSSDRTAVRLMPADLPKESCTLLLPRIVVMKAGA